MSRKVTGPASEPESAGAECVRAAAVVLIATRDSALGARVAETLEPDYAVRVVQADDRVVAVATELRPELVIVEGAAMCAALRSAEATSGTPIFVVADRLAPSEVSAAFAGGATDCLQVPFHPGELLSRVKAQVHLHRLSAELARKERLAVLGSLAASVAHNVRNPLSALLSGLPAMRRRLAPHLDAGTSELVDVLVDCAERIERTTLDLLDLSRIDRDASAAFAPGNGLLACTRMLAVRLVDGSVVLDSDVDVLAMTCGRAGDVNHAFVNVLDNALRAIDGAGRIEIRGSVQGGEYVVQIGDSGPGIDPASLERVFEPFWTTRPAGQGTGLGLAIARRIVEEHAGTIVAGRSPLGGAEFTIRLPLRPIERAVA